MADGAKIHLENGKLVFNTRCVHNLATYLNPRRNHLVPLGKKAVVVKGCDARAVAGLIRETQLKREDVVVIGDTPHDVDCARACGAVAVAVATGQYPREALLADRPDHFFEDLSDTERVLRALLGERV